VFAPSENPTVTPTSNPSVTPTVQPSLAPTRTSKLSEVHFLNKFDDLLQGSGDSIDSAENLDEFLASCTTAIRTMFTESSVSCVNAWSIASIDQMVLRIQDFCGDDCDSFDNVETYISQYGLSVPGFGDLYTTWTGTPEPMSEAPSASTTPPPTIPCASFDVDVSIAVWLGATVDWSITMDSITIVEEGQPEPPSCHANAASYLGPDNDGDDPIPYTETCCLPGGSYVLTCKATFDWGDSSVSVDGQEYCRGLDGELQTHIIHLEGPVWDPTSEPELTTSEPTSPAVPDVPSESDEEEFDFPCEPFDVDVSIAVWMGATVDWSITKDSITIVEEGQPEPPACHATSASYFGPDNDGDDPIPYTETCCLPGGSYVLTCKGTFDWGDSSVSVNGEEYCRGLNGEMETHIIHIDGPAYNPDGDLEESSASALFSVFSMTFIVLALF